MYRCALGAGRAYLHPRSFGRFLLKRVREWIEVEESCLSAFANFEGDAMLDPSRDRSAEISTIQPKLLLDFSLRKRASAKVVCLDLLGLSCANDLSHGGG